LFNEILTTSNIPKKWLEGIIVPIYKNKGDPRDADNYRGITLVSCLAKLFTRLLNNRLDNHILNENQAGFRRNYSTNVHIYLLKCIIDLFIWKRQKLYCVCIDYKKAFDSVWRVGLWRKLINCGVKGKLLTIIKNLYGEVKSCIRIDGALSEYFLSSKGLRQGENLSLLFTLCFIRE